MSRTENGCSAHVHPWKISDVIVYPLLGAGLALELSAPAGFLPGGILGVAVRVAGAALLIVAGGVMIALTRATLARANQPHLPGKATTRLLIDGPFAISRNPMYLGAVLMVASAAFTFDSLWFVGAAALTSLVLDRWMVGPEEAFLAKTFGAEFDAYRARTRRWL